MPDIESTEVLEDAPGSMYRSLPVYGCCPYHPMEESACGARLRADATQVTGVTDGVTGVTDWLKSGLELVVSSK